MRGARRRVRAAAATAAAIAGIPVLHALAGRIEGVLGLGILIGGSFALAGCFIAVWILALWPRRAPAPTDRLEQEELRLPG